MLLSAFVFVRASVYMASIGLSVNKACVGACVHTRVFVRVCACVSTCVCVRVCVRCVHPLQQLDEQPGEALHDVRLQVGQSHQLIEQADEQDVVLLTEPQAVQLQEPDHTHKCMNHVTTHDTNIVSRQGQPEELGRHSLVLSPVLFSVYTN